MAALGALFIVGSGLAWLSPDQTGSFRCARADGRCVVVSGSRQHELALSTIRRALVSHSRASGHSLKLETTGSPQILTKASMHGDSEREYKAAATAINALVEGRSAAVHVAYTARAGIMPWIFVVFIGLVFVAAGVSGLTAARRPAGA
jgi:hypothetical protein